MTQLRDLWQRARQWYVGRPLREQRLVIAMAVVGVIFALDFLVVEPIRAYRAEVAEEVEAGLQKLEHDARKVGHLDEIKTRRDQLRKQLEQAKTRLLPGDTGTLGAAALQDKTNAVAAEKSVTVQSTQVMKDEPAEPFRKVAVRLTLSAEPKPFAEFLSAVEFGQQLNVPFVEISRRGAVPGQKGPRTMQISVEVSGFVLESRKAKENKETEEKSGEADAAGVEAAGEPGAAAEPTGAPDEAAPTTTTSTAADAAAPPALPTSSTVPVPPPSTPEEAH
ncbi:MAG: type II secretion system protein GspM [Candidatus Binatia bacterium]